MYEKLWSTLPLAVRSLTITGAKQGGGTKLTVTLAVDKATPPAPLHVIEYTVVVAGETACAPDVEVAVVHTEAQETALVDVQERTELDPKLIEGGLAVKDTVGEDAGGGHESDERADTEFENMESPTELVAFTL